MRAVRRVVKFAGNPWNNPIVILANSKGLLEVDERKHVWARA